MINSIIEHLAAVTPLYRASQDAGIWFLMLGQQNIANVMEFFPSHKETK